MIGAKSPKRTAYWEGIKAELAISAPVNAARGRRSGSSYFRRGARGRTFMSLQGRGQISTTASHKGRSISRRVTKQRARRAHRG